MANANPYGVAHFSYIPNIRTTPVSLITDMQSMGLSRLRVQMPWTVIEPVLTSGSPTYIWTNLDDIVSRVNTAGLFITFVIENQPTFYPTSNAGPYTGVIRTIGNGGKQIILTASPQVLTADNGATIVVSGGTYLPERVGVANIATTFQTNDTINLLSVLQHPYGRTTIQWYGFPDPGAVQRFAVAVATRYNGKNGHGFIDTFEIGGEEYDSQGPTYYGDSPSIFDNGIYYARVLNVVAPAIRGASPQAKIGLAPLWWNELPHVTNKLSSMFANITSSSLWDFCTFHYYPYESGTNGLVDVLRSDYAPPGNGSVVPSYPLQIQAMAQVLKTSGSANKPIYTTELAWYTLNNTIYRSPISAVDSYDVQARNYFAALEVARKSGYVNGYSFWTLDYAVTPDNLATDVYGNPISDADSLVQVSTNPTTQKVTTVYTPAFYQIKAYIARWPDFSATLGHGHTFLAFDSFISLPNLVPGHQRSNITGSFGIPSDAQFGDPLSSPSDWHHYGAGKGTPSFSNDEGHVAASSASIDYFRLGNNAAVNQEVVMRIATVTSTDLIGLCARLTGAATDSSVSCYMAYVQGNALSLAKVVNGVLSVLRSITVLHMNGLPYYMRFTVTGTTATALNVTLWACDCITAGNGVTVEPSTPLLTYLDTTVPLQSASGFGFAVRASTSSPVSFDTFMVTQPPS